MPVIDVAKASHERIKAISWISVLTSADLLDLERSWLSFARRAGCLEMWTWDGRGAIFCWIGL